MGFNCYYDYSTGKKILISGCYGSLYDRPEYCTCSGGVIDSRKKTTKKVILKLSEEVSELKTEILKLKNIILEKATVYENTK